MIPHNNVRKDTLAVRAERLRWVKRWHEEIAVKLGLTAEIAAWAAMAYDEFWEFMPDKGSDSYKGNWWRNYRKPYTVAGIGADFQPAKRLIQALYADLPALLCEFDVHKSFPKRKADALARVSHTADTLERHAAEHPGVAPATPPEMVAELRAIVARNTEYAAENREKEAERRRKAVQFGANWERDRRNLLLLHALWKARRPEHLTAKEIGFREERARRAGMPPAPENLRFEGGLLKWDAAARATSYQVSVRQLAAPGRRADKKFTEYYAGEGRECAAPPAPCVAKVRARNSNGFGKYSEEFAL